ncbi:VRR-NUC domain-containing protein [Dokdonella sp. MW10]|uniref:VRR-NUC domain-containing protein n=1 Tax=Dokdonella sp. MW10 TaxID=2992926 RepID=UPI003F80D2FB
MSRWSSAAPVFRKSMLRPPRRDDEHAEQAQFILRIRALAINDPRFARAASRTYAIPNGGGRSKAQAGKLKAEGVRAGVSDIFVSLPSGRLCGLYIEMKSKTGDPSREQREWLAESVDLGYGAACCRGAEEAMQVWRTYVEASWS